ncbi:MAG: synthase subunit [Nocardioidaceae bacterium]|jgi:F-type H+-transporting ATPase subunit b|nr:synthase subunit [Nocardioidaceae bacterium]
MSRTNLAAENFLVPNATIIVELLAFLVILFLLARFIIPPINRALTERQEAIRRQFEESEQAKQAAEAAEQEFRAELADARHEAARIREDAREQGAAIIAEMREQAQAESRRIIAASHAQLDADRQRVLTEMRAEVGDLATTLAGLIVGETLDDDARQQRTVERFIADLETETADGAGPADGAQPAEAPTQPSGSAAGSTAGPAAAGPSPDAAPSTPGGGGR